MPALAYGLSSYERAEGNIAELPVVNMYAEQTASEGVVLQSRPPLVDRVADMGAGPVRALLKADGVLSGDLIGVSGSSLYRGIELLGGIDGTGPSRLAGNELGAMATRGQTLYYYNGTTLATVAFPDSAAVADVFVGGGRFWAIRKDTGRLYWTDVLEADIEALDFVTAESFPDRLLQGLWIDGMPILCGAESIEFWQQTRQANPPIAPLQNMVIERGIKNTGAACRFGETIAAVTNENTVIYGPQGQIISNPGLQERIAASAEAFLFTFFIDGVEFLALRIDDETQVFNGQTWSEFASEGEANWVANCYAAGVFGSAVDGKTLAWGTGKQDLGGVLKRSFRAGLPINGGGVDIYRLSLRVNPGNTPFLAGDYADPTVEMRVSRDTGRTWDAWQPASLGVQGAYRDRVEWRALGLASQPAFLAEFRVSDPVAFRVAGVFANEQFGGR